MLFDIFYNVTKNILKTYRQVQERLFHIYRKLTAH